MKIESSTKTHTAPLVKESRVPVSDKPEPAGDEVRLSGLSSSLHASGDEQPFDAARVAEIKSAIAQGRFSINPEAIADRLINSAREMIDSQRKA
jgi:negative regulator of flagellin synthesis FlgM